MRYQILKILQTQGDFISGEAIAKDLNISRTAVWKSINKLKQEGYNIIPSGNKGYCILDEPCQQDVLNEFEILQNLKTDNIGRKIISYDEVGSTNTAIRELIMKKYSNSNEIESLLVIANKQSQGKGRLGRNWISDPKKSIFFSFSIKPELHPFTVQTITLLVGIAIARSIRNLTGYDISLKWPNDIIINDRKVGGVLTEINAEIEKINFIIIGIGINLNNTIFDEEISKKASSVFIQTGVRLGRATVIQEILYEFEKIYKQFLSDNSFEIFRQEYICMCINIGKFVKVIDNKKEIIGEVVDISETGSIIIKNSKNEELQVFSGEVSIRNEDGEYI